MSLLCGGFPREMTADESCANRLPAFAPRGSSATDHVASGIRDAYSGSNAAHFQNYDTDAPRLQ